MEKPDPLYLRPCDSVVPIRHSSFVIRHYNVPVTSFTPDERSRYSRHLMLPQVGVEGQARLKAGSVLLVGAGGLGSPAALYLAAAGVGRIGIVDFDRVDLSNLHRQVLHGTGDVGRMKTDSAADALESANPEVEVTLHATQLSSENALAILGSYDVIVDGTDNFPTRYLVNDACVMLKKPNVYGSVFRFEGQASVFYPPESPCYRCLYPEPPPAGLVPSCAEGGVLGVLPGIIGLIQATETIKLITGIGESLAGRLLLFDALQMRFREMKLRKDPACRMCGTSPAIHELIDYEAFCGVPQEAPLELGDRISPLQLKERIDQGNAPTLLDVREPHEWEICSIEGSTRIPLGSLLERLDELNPDEQIVVYCRSGSRSGRAMHMLRGSGFSRVTNLEGGILRWGREVDPTMPAY